MYQKYVSLCLQYTQKNNNNNNNKNAAAVSEADCVVNTELALKVLYARHSHSFRTTALSKTKLGRSIGVVHHLATYQNQSTNSYVTMNYLYGCFERRAYGLLLAYV